jgi:hypothetical protein
MDTRRIRNVAKRTDIEIDGVRYCERSRCTDCASDDRQ